MSDILQIIKDSQKDLTSNDPVKKARAEEIKRRYEQGLFNAELTKAGYKPVPVKQPKIDMSAIKAIPQQEGLQSVAGKTRKEDIVNDFREGLKGFQEILPTRGTAAAEDMRNMGKFKTFGQGGFGALAQGVGAFLDTAGIVAKTAAKMAMTPDQEAQWMRGLEKVAQNPAVKSPVELVTTALEDLRETNPELANSIGDALTLSEFLVGGSKPVREGVEAVVDVGKMTGPALEQGAKMAEKAAVATARTADNVVRAVTPDTTGVAESLIANINRINPSKRQEFKMMQGVSEEQWLRQRGIVGSRETTIKQLAENFTALRQNVDEAMAKIPGTFRDNRITAVADEALAHAKAVESPELAAIQELANKARGTGITMSEMNRLKRYYERNVKVGYLKDPTKTAEAVQLATNRDSALREFQFEMADKAGFDNLRQLNKEIQANKFLADEIAGKMEGQGANNLMSLTDWIVATPGLAVDPTFLAGFAGKKLISSEFMKVAAAKALAGFPNVKPLPRADLAEIEKRAQAYLQRQESTRMETEKMALLANELQQAGFTMSEGTRAFITENPIPLSKNEQALIKAARGNAEQKQILQYILEMRTQGKAVGDGFTMQDVDNTPLLNPQDRFDPNKMEPDIQMDAEPEPGMFERSVRDMSVGLSIKPSVTPEKVAANMTAEDADWIRKYLNNDINADLRSEKILKAMEINKADDATQRRFLQEALDNYNERWAMDGESFNEGEIPETKAQTTTAMSGGGKGSTDLLEEARKYPDAESFIEAQGKTLYHGTDLASAKNISKKGFQFSKGKPGVEKAITDKLIGDVMFFAETPQATKGFARVKFGKQPSVIKAVGNLKLATPADVKKVIKGEGTTAYREAIEELKRQGFDGLKKGSNDIAVWNIDKIKTRTQLEDIWKQANKTGTND